MRRPCTRLTAAATSDSPKLSLSAARTRAVKMVSKKPGKPRVAVFSTSPARGISTMRLSQVKVRPSVNPKPGITLGLRQLLVKDVTADQTQREDKVSPLCRKREGIADCILGNPFTRSPQLLGL